MPEARIGVADHCVNLSDPEVRGVQNGSTLLWRVVKEPFEVPKGFQIRCDLGEITIFKTGPSSVVSKSLGIRCPWGVPGDTLVMRETHWRRVNESAPVVYDAELSDSDRDFYLQRTKYTRRSSTQMPTWAARYRPKLLEVSVQRVGVVTFEDVRDSGCPQDVLDDPEDQYEEGPPSWFSAGKWFEDTWNERNPKTPRDSNPWGWRLRLEGGQ